MKGTAVRGRTLAEDEAQIDWLRQSEKNRAENVMIVDMIRNDIGRVARVGSVSVPRLFDIERYPTVLQMTSTVNGRSDASLPDILAAMFPCASITGAPKVRTMEIIRELEPAPRGVYTGAIGTISPGRQAQFNVAIRTVTIDRTAQRATYNVGSGIVWDSDASDEYAECRLKSRVLVEQRPSFDLLESLLWTPAEGYFLLDEHLDRLAASAAYFGVVVARARVRAELQQRTVGLDGVSKVRVLVDEHGRVRSQAVSLDAGATVEPVRVGLAAMPVDPANIWLYHKTTHRAVYDAARASRPDCDDVLLWNSAGELTEASSSNLVVRLDGELVTPPVTSGLLAGTFRRNLLEAGELVERPVRVADLAQASELFLINSVRGWRTAVVLETDALEIAGRAGNQKPGI
nr:putative para-aminobenzoate synthase, component I [uncultured bacterium]